MGDVVSFGVAVLTVLSVMRLTRLVTLDTLTDGTCLRFVNWLGAHGLQKLQWFFHKVLTCSWCASIWVGAAVVPAAYFWGEAPWFTIAAMILLASQLTGLTFNTLDSGSRAWSDD